MRNLNLRICKILTCRSLLFYIALIFFHLCGRSAAQTPGKTGFRFYAEGSNPVNQLLSNSVIDLVPDSMDILMGTGKGLSVRHLETQSWSSFDESFGLGRGSISALDVKDGVIWAATAYTENTSVGLLPAGGGVGFSTDGGFTWTWFDQPVDPDTVTTYSPTTTNVQNVTYDLLITTTEVWIASWGGGLRKFSFADSAWHVVTPDTLAFSSYDHLNHRAFAVVGDDSILWVGTAAGINKSTDGGQTWTNYSYSANGLSGNFITALGLQRWSGHEVLWAATWPAQGSGEYYGISKTENGGLTWEVALTDSLPLKGHNFAFDDSVAYVASNLGLHKSIDGGVTWELFPQIKDVQSGEILYDPEVYSALSYQGTLWVGTGDGVASSNDLGNTWTIYRAFLPTGQAGQPGTYAYPNPFSPRISPYIVRLQYDMPHSGTVTVKIYDFALDRVATVVDGKSRSAGDYYEVWDGKRDDGTPVAAGVYYYQIERSGSGPVWGKIAVIP